MPGFERSSLGLLLQLNVHCISVASWLWSACCVFSRASVVRHLVRFLSHLWHGTHVWYPPGRLNKIYQNSTSDFALLLWMIDTVRRSTRITRYVFATVVGIMSRIEVYFV